MFASRSVIHQSLFLETRALFKVKSFNPSTLMRHLTVAGISDSLLVHWENPRALSRFWILHPSDQPSGPFTKGKKKTLSHDTTQTGAPYLPLKYTHSRGKTDKLFPTYCTPERNGWGPHPHSQLHFSQLSSLCLALPSD